MIKYFIVLLLFFFVSCGSNKSKLSDNNYFNRNYFYNDSLKVGIDFDKNVQFREISFDKEKEFRQLLKSNKLSSKDLFLVAAAKEKGLEMYFFYQNVPSSSVKSNNIKTVISDTVNNTLFLEKQKGKRKVLGLVKTTSAKDNNSSIFVNDLLNKIAIDSLNTRKISFISIFMNNFPDVHPNPLFASKKLESAPIKSVGGEDDKFQFLSTVNASISNNKLYDTLIVGYEKERKEKFNSLIIDLSNKDDVYKDNAVFGKISEIAKENQVIMLNEDHYYPKHRLFAMELLETLKGNGYNYLSLEGFNSKSSEKESTPNYKNGIYTDEPYFAHFIRKAIALGFTVSGHENFDKGIDRELGQAKNVIKILEKDPKAKIFVYVGHSHIEKKNEKKKWLAEYFKELSGINPITINQTVICADTKQDLTLMPCKYFNDTTKVKSSADYFLVNNMKPSLKIIYPNAAFKKAIIRGSKFSDYKNKQVLVEIVDFKEFDLMKNLAIPIESYLMIPKNGTINFELPTGKYHIFIKTEDDEIIYDDDLIVG
ncbi:hypothetical protein [Flavobacterium granuli]|uniref:Erythromycin esterase homolog n=1 Tax=Flavobacterium granuli TaxID=280093 RepID=A0ABU1S4Q6_9FLAO|nr:hypothetical protein [Flavobacterium granuli]MDR6845610.1 hypothetical protein [Flavobacterium granuli]